MLMTLVFASKIETKKKKTKTPNYVSCFSLHFFCALAAPFVFYNRTEHTQAFFHVKYYCIQHCKDDGFCINFFPFMFFF